MHDFEIHLLFAAVKAVTTKGLNEILDVQSILKTVLTNSTKEGIMTTFYR